MAELIRATSMSGLGPPGGIDFRNDRNTVRLYAIWTCNTPFIGGITVNYSFDTYEGSFCPTEDDRTRDAAPDRVIYGYDPDPRGPFRRGSFHNKQWEAWTIAAPALDVQKAEISVCGSRPGKIIMVGSAITRHNVVIATDGPTSTAAHSWFNF